ITIRSLFGFNSKPNTIRPSKDYTFGEGSIFFQKTPACFLVVLALHLDYVFPAMEEPGPLKRALIDARCWSYSWRHISNGNIPVGFIKIRFQVQLEPTSSWALLRKDMNGSSKYTGMMQATKDILR
ncbi:hypothetical protein MKW98_003138, partial [Papaver atlanticum]